ncbi:3-dehydroquinate synthase [Enterobacteriaceae endosymbiont of Donacia cincticornis]|uniref:3-dehydroquinate synthase n=1 Tax=Enterobacteriaceae endosymbiont of Donacia cincticornis TaxID=2675773 RepID=UPI001449FC77|nr:3-dehydroquinate synthase [Enterobacteriaceae endosymbiont of Donacia cincticornis]QJC36215.1 3-dehydroquinate synthase [Enterobacteriaceae endosymbiont of Donacia cincticornis]
MEKTISISTKKNNYPIIINFNLFDKKIFFPFLKKGDSIMIVTNQKVFSLYFKKIFNQFDNIGLKIDYIILPDGEKYKTLITVNMIFTTLLKNLHNRDTTLVALGGGVIGDITGFAASIYQRGVKYIQIPTTLLSQVDSSIGGKTAVNHDLGKNMIGSFYQPNIVIINLSCLYTLSQREFSAGIAEVIKYSIIFDKKFFSWLENNITKLFTLNKDKIFYCINKCCKLKAKIVYEDEYENNQRALLNLGHTYAHAIEAELGYGKWLHGEAVAVGIVIASVISKELNLLNNFDVIKIINLLKQYKLPTKLPSNIDVNKLLKHIYKDKKVKKKQINIILPVRIGKVIIYNNISEKIIINAINSNKNLLF